MKKILLALMLTLALIFTPACEEPDPEDVCKVITQASAVAYNEVINKNPDLEKPVGDLAYAAVKVLGGESVDVIKAKELIYNMLSNFSSLDEDEKRIIVDMFSIVVPMLELPKEGALGEKATYFTICFFEGVINAVEIKEELKSDEEVDVLLTTLLD
jgi:hypothetical protein